MSERLNKINGLLRDEVGKILRDELDFDSGVLVTVTHALVSPTLEHATIFISTLPKGHEKKTLAQINQQIYKLQQFLNKRLAMRPVPKVRFEVDGSIDRAARIDEILQKTLKSDKVNN
ncbi:MAG: 30S ribosome-binding factor RbfA [Patescibacteria group bacterium]